MFDSNDLPWIIELSISSTDRHQNDFCHGVVATPNTLSRICGGNEHVLFILPKKFPWRQHAIYGIGPKNV